VLAMWSAIAVRFENQAAIAGQPLKAQDKQGVLRAWVVAAAPGEIIKAETEFSCLDVIRNPRLLYVCRDCGKYGPLQCLKCDDVGEPARLCSKHALFIKDELSAYCAQHLPKCQCSSDCTHPASFRCRHCRRLFGEHNSRKHLHDDEIEYCLRCYRRLFENCVPCQQAGRRRLGKSKCGFQSLGADAPCETPLCWTDSVQWRVWGANNRGISLCPFHVPHISRGDVADLLFTLLAARPPLVPVRSGSNRRKRAGMPNLFRLRKMLNHQRMQKLRPTDILQSLLKLEAPIRSAGLQRLTQQFEYMKRSYGDLLRDVAAREPELLARVRNYYVQRLGRQWGERIHSLEIVDRFGNPLRYRVELTVDAASIGHLIGPRGRDINPLRNELAIEIDMTGGGT